MPTPTPSELANAARCYNSCIPAGMENPVIIYLLAQLVLQGNPRFDTDAGALMAGARCYNSCVPPGMEVPVMNYLLNQILELNE